MSCTDFALSSIPTADSSPQGDQTSLGKRNRRKKSGPESESSGCPKIDLACPRHKDRLMTGINEMFSSRPFADVVVVVADQQFEAHRVILAAASDYFRYVSNIEYIMKIAYVTRLFC
jgi:hypothetical protein